VIHRFLLDDQRNGTENFIASGKARVVEEVADIKATMATKTDLADFKMEVVDLVTGEFAKFRTEHIDRMKRDIADLKQTSDKVWNAFAPRLEYDDRLRVIEQKLGTASPQ
jgi:hypothetical protein